MDPKASNYDPEAEKEDGSCRYKGNSGAPPETYSFEDAELRVGRIRIELLDRLCKKVAAGKNGASISFQELLDLYRNNGMVGNGETDLEGTLNNGDSIRFLGILQSISNRSGSPGALVAGSFVGPDSIAFLPLVRNGLMGASFFRYATEELLEGLEMKDHSDPNGGKATPRERDLDEAFSLFGVPRDFSRNTSPGTGNDHEEGAWFWGVTCLRTDDALEHLPGFFAAFIEGRWAVTQEKKQERKAAVQKVEQEWERTAAAVMVRHIKRTIKAIDQGSLGDRIQHWSKAHAVLLSLNANSDGIIDASSHQALRDRLGDSPNETSVQALNDALAILQSEYAFSNEAFQSL